MICEVTMLNSRDQWFNEGQPVMRHLREFEDSYTDSCCVFIAPTIHTDTSETFYIANTFGYKGYKQKIAPLTINQLIEILKVLRKLRQDHKQFSHENLRTLVYGIAESANNFNNSDEWIVHIQEIINSWTADLVN
jgi:hypothetical protein